MPPDRLSPSEHGDAQCLTTSDRSDNFVFRAGYAAASSLAGTLCPQPAILQKVALWLGGETPVRHRSLSDMECDLEGDSDGQSSSMVCIRASEAFPMRPLQTDDDGLTLPFTPLNGECATHVGRTTDGVIVLSNYRLFIHLKETFFNVPLGLIESVECRESFLLVYCKDARTIKCTFPSNEHCLEWHKRLTASLLIPAKLDDVFAFAHYAWHSEVTRDDTQQAFSSESLGTSFEAEVERMGFDLKNGGAWRISSINSDYSLCASYPRDILVPRSVTEEVLAKVSSFRSSRRIPAVVWRHQTNGCVIARSSQPEVGWLGWRNSDDEGFLQEIAKACALDSDNLLGKVSDESEEKAATVIPKLLIVDARSYAAAVANRAKGGGCECQEYYPSCEIQFMSLANIHSVRRSFQSVRVLCGTNSEQMNWYSGLENTKWLHHIGGLLRSALMVVNTIDSERRPVLVHCSDGWDRTPQIVALAELMLDPYYRTMHGFQVLVEREWLEFGHKFGDRCGHGLPSDDTNERCPVFMQWLDCVYQLLQQFPCNFEFNSHFLVRLALHTYSCLFGTFLCNSSMERRDNYVRDRTYSVWAFLQNNESAVRFRNYLYTKKDQVLRPSYHVRDLLLWSAVYLQGSDSADEPVLGSCTAPSTATSSSLSTPQGEGAESTISDVGERVGSTVGDAGAGGCGNGNSCATPAIAKTRSCVDLLSLGDQPIHPRQRRSSDPSVDGLQQQRASVTVTTDDFAAAVKSEDDASEDDDLVGAEATLAGLRLLEGAAAAAADNGHTRDTDDEDSTEETLAERVTLAPQALLTNGHAGSGRRGGCEADSENEEEDDTEPTLSECKSGDYPCLPTIETSTDTLVGELACCEAPRMTNGETILLNLDVDGTILHRCSDSDCLSDDVSCCEGTSRNGRFPASCVVPTGLPDGLAQHVSTSTTDLRQEHASGTSLPRHPAAAWSSCPSHGVDHFHPPLPPAAGVDQNGWNSLVADGGKCVLCLNGSGGMDRRRCIEANLELLKQLSSGGRGSGGGVASAHTPSRTPSSGFPATPSDERLSENGGVTLIPHRAGGGGPFSVGRRLDVDGMSLTPDEAQQRLHELFTEHQATRYSLQQTFCLLRLSINHQQKSCSRCYVCSRNCVDHSDDVGSMNGSVGSVDGGHQSSLGQETASSSDLSWEQVDERETKPVLWVPDHAVLRCAKCSLSFGLTRRKHHCRSCGEIFCFECSKQVMPVPSENLFDPVRVCVTCYERHGNKQTSLSPQPSSAPFNDMKMPKAILAGTPSSN